jgi:hypothetical protein
MKKPKASGSLLNGSRGRLRAQRIRFIRSNVSNTHDLWLKEIFGWDPKPLQDRDPN